MHYQYNKRLGLTFLAAILASTMAAKATAPANPTPYDSAGLPLNRYSPLEIMTLKSLTADQKQKLIDFYTNGKVEQSTVMNDLAAIWINEAHYYPELAALASGSTKEMLPAELDSHDQQIEAIRIKIYSAAATHEPADEKKLEEVYKPKETIAEYGVKEKILVTKFNTLLNENSQKAVAMLTKEQQAELKNLRDKFEKENARHGDAGK